MRWLARHCRWAIGGTIVLAATAQGALVGDTNCDGVIDFDDIDAFVLALSDPLAYEAEFPNCDLCTADINRDGVVDADDIDPFVECLVNGGCGNVHCPPVGACCFSNGLCLEIEPASCTDAGGRYFGDDTVCTLDLCPLPAGACCYPDHSCVETDEVTCDNAEGIYRGDHTSCAPGLCASPLGACCYPNGSCVESDAQTCQAEGAQYQGDATTCETTHCPLPTGACCYHDGTCVDTGDQNACESAGGVYEGDGTSCSPSSCPVFGACCYPDGSCIETEELTCAHEGGQYKGDGTTCAGVYCPPPVGACCYPDGSCVVTDQSTCQAENGRYRGDDTTCDPNLCPPPIGACCYPDSSCVESDPNTCAAAGAIYHGDGSTCAMTVCPSPTGACCYLGTCAVTDQATCEFYGGNYQGDNSSCTPNPCPICVVRPPPPDPLDFGPFQPGRLRLDISRPNIIRGGSGALFPEAPDDTLQQDGVDPADFATARRGADAINGWDLRARIYYPATVGGQDTPVAPGGPFPLVVIAHGNHTPLRRPHGPNVTVNDENYRGYIYLQEHLARHGFISVSVDLDDLFTVFPGILSRAWVVLCHVRNMEAINGTAGHRLRNQIDMSRILLLGHSRGGEAVVQAWRMNLDDTGPYGSLQADPLNRRIFNFRAVFSLAATRFFDGTKNWDPRLALGHVDESRIARPPHIPGGRAVPFTPFLGMWGDADGDVNGSSGLHTTPGGFFPLPPKRKLYANAPDVIALHVEGIYDRSDSDPKQFVWIEGANHNFWNTSWYDLSDPANPRGDDGLNLVPDRISDAEQQDLLSAYGLSFARGYLFADATALDYRRYFKGPANELPAAPIAQTTVHLQYQDIPANRDVVDNFEDANLNIAVTSRGVAGVTSSTDVTVAELRLFRGEAPSFIDTTPAAGNYNVGDTYADRSWFHNTFAALMEWNQADPMVFPFYTTVCPPGGGGGTDARAYDVLSFRIALDIRGPGAAPELAVDVTLLDGGGQRATVRTSTVTSIPVGQDRSDSIFEDFLSADPRFPDTPFLTKSMLKTIRLPLCSFRENNRAIDLSDIRRIRFVFFDRAAGKIGLDDIEFSR